MKEKKPSMTNLTSGMSNIELCRLIRECGRSGVSRLSYNGLDIVFSSDRPLELSKTFGNKTTLASPPIEMHMTPEQEAIMKDASDLQLAIDDPVAFERMMISDDLEGAARDERVENFRTQQDVHGGGGF